MTSIVETELPENHQYPWDRQAVNTRQQELNMKTNSSQAIIRFKSFTVFYPWLNLRVKP